MADPSRPALRRAGGPAGRRRGIGEARRDEDEGSRARRVHFSGLRNSRLITSTRPIDVIAPRIAPIIGK